MNEPTFERARADRESLGKAGHQEVCYGISFCMTQRDARYAPRLFEHHDCIVNINHGNREIRVWGQSRYGRGSDDIPLADPSPFFAGVSVQTRSARGNEFGDFTPRERWESVGKKGIEPQRLFAGGDDPL